MNEEFSMRRPVLGTAKFINRLVALSGTKDALHLIWDHIDPMLVRRAWLDVDKLLDDIDPDQLDHDCLVAIACVTLPYKKFLSRRRDAMTRFLASCERRGLEPIHPIMIGGSDEDDR